MQFVCIPPDFIVMNSAGNCAVALFFDRITAEDYLKDKPHCYLLPVKATVNSDNEIIFEKREN